MGRGKTHHKPHVWGKPAPYLEFPVGSKEYAILRARENERERELEKQREVQIDNRSPPRRRVKQVM